MTNPVVTFYDYIPTPSDPTTVRKTYLMKVFDSVKFFIYPHGESSSTLDPTNMGPEFYNWYMVSDGMQGIPATTLPPAFIADDVWDGIQGSPSGFITPNNSVMPKLFTPSQYMVDNGIQATLEVMSSSAALWEDFSDYKELFNWVMDTFNGVAVDRSPTGNWAKYAQMSGSMNSQFASFKAKDDKLKSNSLVMHLNSPPVAPPTGDWDSTNLVVSGAFMLLLNIIGTNPGQANTDSVKGGQISRWKLTITFGEVTMIIADASTMTVTIAGSKQVTTVNLAEGLSKEGPPQQQYFPDKPPLLIGVYPVWDGIIVTSGTQETVQVVKTAGTFCRKTNSASIQDPAYCSSGGVPGWFNPKQPNDVVVSVDADVQVNFGTQMNIVADNCRFELAYLPRFFTKAMKMDGWRLLSTDTADSTYAYNIYTIYTKNGTSFDFMAKPTLVNSGHVGTIADTAYWYVPWHLVSDKTHPHYLRWAGEIFGYILETIQTAKFSLKNDNGRFALTWSGGTPGDAAPTIWTDYIKSISVTSSIDGSSGSITVDKYGVAGQDAIADQKIGAVVLSASGGDGTIAGTIFAGIGMGVANANSSGDSTWTIPLIGLEKKLDDMALINPPFMDGESLSTALDYLCRYAGINYEMGHVADPGQALSTTEEVDSARFDWKSGTSVRTALEDVLADVNCSYCIIDGIMQIYQLDDYGLPVGPYNPDQSGNYDGKNMVSVDQTPDFENMRNYLVAVALRKYPEGTGTDIQNNDAFPELVAATPLNQVPDVPWAKCQVRVYSAPLARAVLESLVDKMQKMSNCYQVTGKLTIPGNATIKPYDLWGEYIVYSVTHNVDLEAKTWTTDLEFQRRALSV